MTSNTLARRGMFAKLSLAILGLSLMGFAGCGEDNDKTAMEGSGPGRPPANAPNIRPNTYNESKGQMPNATNPMQSTKGYPKPSGS